MAITKAGGRLRRNWPTLRALCSRHKYLHVGPLIFTMISNHFPDATFGRDCGWAILGGLGAAGFRAAKIITRLP